MSKHLRVSRVLSISALELLGRFRSTYYWGGGKAACWLSVFGRVTDESRALTLIYSRTKKPTLALWSFLRARTHHAHTHTHTHYTPTSFPISDLSRCFYLALHIVRGCPAYYRSYLIRLASLPRYFCFVTLLHSIYLPTATSLTLGTVALEAFSSLLLFLWLDPFTSSTTRVVPHRFAVAPTTCLLFTIASCHPLFRALDTINLDFFVVFSSLSLAWSHCKRVSSLHTSSQ